MYKVKWGWYGEESNYELFEPEDGCSLAEAKRDSYWSFIETVQCRDIYGIDWCAWYHRQKSDESWEILKSWSVIDGFQDWD